MNQTLQIDRPEQHIAKITLQRPEVRNAINRTLIEEMRNALTKLQNEKPRVLIITGGSSAFSAGADLREIKTLSPLEGRAFSLAGHRLFEQIERFPAPVLAAVNGYALGGGCELALACDLRYAAASARLGQPETHVGLIPAWGGTFRLPRYIGVARAKEMIFTAESVTAEKAHKMGLVNQVFPDEEFQEKVLARAHEIASQAPVANRLSKQLLNRSSNDTQAMITEESLAFSYCINTEDQSEAVEAFLDKRAPKFRNR